MADFFYCYFYHYALLLTTDGLEHTWVHLEISPGGSSTSTYVATVGGCRNLIQETLMEKIHPPSALDKMLSC